MLNISNKKYENDNLFIFKKIFGNDFAIFSVYVDDKNIIKTPEELMRYCHFLQNKYLKNIV